MTFPTDSLSNLQGAEHAARIAGKNTKTDAVVRNGDGTYDELEAHANAMEREADAMRIGNGHLMDRIAAILLHLRKANDTLTAQLQDAPSGRDWNEVFSARVQLREAIILATTNSATTGNPPAL